MDNPKLDAVRLARFDQSLTPTQRDEFNFCLAMAQEVERVRILDGVTAIRKRIENGSNTHDFDRTLGLALRIEAAIRGGNFV